MNLIALHDKRLKSVCCARIRVSRTGARTAETNRPPHLREAVLAPTFTSGTAETAYSEQRPFTGVLDVRALATAGWLKPKRARSPVNGTNGTNQLADPVLKHGANTLRDSIRQRVFETTPYYTPNDSRRRAAEPCGISPPEPVDYLGLNSIAHSS